MSEDFSDDREISTEQKLEVALRLLGDTPTHAKIWALEMKLIQKECLVMDARRRIKTLEEELSKYKEANNVRT